MKQRLARTITCIIIAVMMLSVMTLFPHAAEGNAAQTAQPAQDATTSSLPTIEEQIRAYAKSIDQPKADSKASSALASHGVNGGGKKLTVGEGHALTATIWNSEIFQRIVSEGCTNAVEVMQQMGWAELPYVKGDCNWYGNDSSFHLAIYSQNSYEDKYRDFVLTNDLHYEGIQNGYDESLEWMAGSAYVFLTIKLDRVTTDEAVYKVTCVVGDRFDFSTGSNSGFKDFISSIGAVLFREYDWETVTTFELSAPFSCSHTSGAYQWTYDAVNKELVANNYSNGYKEDATRCLSQSIPNGYYYKLDETIRLYHNKPWVLEYDVQNPGHFVLSPSREASISQPCFMNAGRKYLAILDYDRITVSDQIREEYNLSRKEQRISNIYGTLLIDYFSYSQTETYTFRLENKLLPNNKNMICLTVLNTATGEILLKDATLDNYYRDESWIQTKIWQSRTDDWQSGRDWVSGKDLFINYIGNEERPFSPDYFVLRVWENGIDGGTDDYFDSKIIAPTCAEQGYTLHTCSCCGYSYKDNFVPALAHTFGTDKITAPTCTAQGYTSHTCTDCGYTYKDSYTSALGHKFGTGTQTVAPTCTAPGKELYTCSVCAATETRETPAAGHRYFVSVTLPTCTEQGYTNHACFCGDVYTDEYVPAKGHVMGDWTSTQKPTCTEDGFGSRECIYCHATETGVIPTTAHTASGAVKESQVLPTCSADGQYDSVVYCKDCHTELSRTVEILEKIGHSYPNAWTLSASPTCTQNGSETRTCRRCGNVQSRELEAIGHSYLTATVTPPTCTQNGYTTHTCHCGAEYKDNPTRATGHDMSAWTPIQAPTCENTGVEQRTCYTCHTQEIQLIQPSGHAASEAVTENRTAPTCTEQGTYELATYCTVCSAELERVFCTIAALGHAPATEWTVDVEPDCTNAGSKSHRCTRCDRATDHAEIPATGHDFGEWYQTATPTCTQEGTRKQDCTRCDYAESEQISATGHSYTQAVIPPTCTEQGYTTHTCHCGEHYTDSYTDALGHTESDWIVDSEPTAVQDGSRHTECTVCHTVLKTEAIEAIPETTEPETDTETETEPEFETETETETEPEKETTGPQPETEIETETQPEPEPGTAPNGCKSLLGGNLLFAILLPAILPLGKKRRG